MLSQLSTPARTGAVSSEGFSTPASLAFQPRGASFCNKPNTKQHRPAGNRRPVSVCVICSVAVARGEHVCLPCEQAACREAQSLSVNPNPVNR